MRNRLLESWLNLALATLLGLLSISSAGCINFRRIGAIEPIRLHQPPAVTDALRSLGQDGALARCGETHRASHFDVKCQLRTDPSAPGTLLIRWSAARPSSDESVDLFYEAISDTPPVRRHVFIEEELDTQSAARTAERACEQTLLRQRWQYAVSMTGDAGELSLHGTRPGAGYAAGVATDLHSGAPIPDSYPTSLRIDQNSRTLISTHGGGVEIQTGFDQASAFVPAPYPDMPLTAVICHDDRRRRTRLFLFVFILVAVPEIESADVFVRLVDHHDPEKPAIIGKAAFLGREPFGSTWVRWSNDGRWLIVQSDRDPYPSVVSLRSMLP